MLPPVAAVVPVPNNLDLMEVVAAAVVGLLAVPALAALALVHKEMMEEVLLVTHALVVAVEQVRLVRQVRHRVMAVQEPQTALLALL